ncbi:MAG: LSU ribosomal protein L6p (L9e), partial [uncultured Gemmatimonadetes bacterium]
VANWKKADPRPRGRGRDHRWQHRARKGPQGRAFAHPALRRDRAPRRRRHPGGAPLRRAALPGAARPQPHAGGQHDRRGDHRVHQDARDRGRGLPRRDQALRADALAGVQPPDRVQGSRGHHPAGGHPHRGRGFRDQQGSGGAGGGRDPVAAPARAVQGQGREVPGRGDPPQGGQGGRQV